MYKPGLCSPGKVHRSCFLINFINTEQYYECGPKKVEHRIIYHVQCGIKHPELNVKAYLTQVL